MSYDKQRRTSSIGGDADTALIPPGKTPLGGQIFRKAVPGRDDNGVAAGADTAVDRAASSSGSTLPTDLRERFETSLGADLTGVRLHTGSESAAAAEAVGAKAYTVGNDVHFGAGHYDPSSSEGLHLIAHEVAHTVQQAGSPPTRQNKLEVSAPQDGAELEADRAAAAMLIGTPFALGSFAPVIARDPLDGFNPADFAKPQHDMQEVNYGGLTPIIDSSDPQPLSIAVGPVRSPNAHGPANPDVPPPSYPKDPWADFDKPGHHGGHHQDPFPPLIDPKQRDREAVWEDYKLAVFELQSNWNSMAPYVQKFNGTTKEHAAELGDALEIAGAPPNVPMDALANGQPGGKTDAKGDTNVNKVTVGQVFNDPSGSPTSTTVDLGQGGDAALDKSKGTLVNEQREIEKVDHRINAAIKKLNGYEATVTGAEGAVAGAMQRAVTEAKKREGEEVAAQQAAVAGKVASAKADIKDWATGIRSVVGILFADSAQGAGTAMAQGAVNLGEIAANRMVDNSVAEEVAGLKTKAEAAMRAVRDSTDSEIAAGITTAWGALEAAHSFVESCRSEVKAALVERRQAYDKLGAAAAAKAKANGASEDSQNRIRAAVSALPIIETVCSHAVNVKGAATPPAYTRGRGMGLGLAEHHGDPSAAQFTSAYAKMLGYHTTFDYHAEFWAMRLAAVRGVVDRLK